MILLTNFLFVTFHRPDLDLTPEEAAAIAATLPDNQKIKGVEYGKPPGHEGDFRAAAYAADVRDRTLPTVTLVITDTKEACKLIYMILLERQDYRALFYTHQLVQHHGGPKLAMNTRKYRASEAYGFRC